MWRRHDAERELAVKMGKKIRLGSRKGKGESCGGDKALAVPTIQSDAN